MLDSAPRSVRFLLTLGGLGRLPVGGTISSCVTGIVLLLLWPVLPVTPGLRALVLVAGIALWSWLCTSIIRRWLPAQHADDRRIVVDEAAGMAVALLPVLLSSDLSLPGIAVAFLMFRFFDITKPLGIRAIDARHDAWSVTADDVVAGGWAGVCALIAVVVAG